VWQVVYCLGKHGAEGNVWRREGRLTGEWRKLHNEEIYSLQAAVLQTSLIRSDKDIHTYEMGGECNMHGRDENSYKILARNPECKPRHRWKVIIKRDLGRLWFEGDWTKYSLLEVWKRQLYFRFHQGRDFLNS
jgi:hypothetical protein